MADFGAAPYRSPEDLEQKAEEVLHYFKSESLASPLPCPIARLLQEAKRQFGLGFECEELGHSPDGKKILGAFRFSPRCVVLDKSLQNDRRAPFVLAHEFGHWVLHRKLVLSKHDYPDIVDTQRDLVTGKRLIKTVRDRIEWQANRFAAALLLPRGTFETAVLAAQREAGIPLRGGTVYVEDKPYSLQDFAVLKRRLADLLNVTLASIEYRLDELGLLTDHRFPGHHISELLSAD